MICVCCLQLLLIHLALSFAVCALNSSVFRKRFVKPFVQLCPELQKCSSLFLMSKRMQKDLTKMRAAFFVRPRCFSKQSGLLNHIVLAVPPPQWQNMISWLFPHISGTSFDFQLQ